MERLSELSSTKERSNEQIEDQINADLFVFIDRRQIVLLSKLTNVLISGLCKTSKRV